MRRPLALVVAAALAACQSSDPEQQRSDAVAFARLASHEARAEMEAADPSLRARLDAAAGWAAFGSTGDSLFSKKRGDGLGLAHDNKKRTDTAMRILVPGTERRLGLTTFRALVVFSDAAAFTQFVKGGDLPAAGEGVDVRWTEDGVAVPPPSGVTCRPE
jgi:hypothetical protein